MREIYDTTGFGISSTPDKKVFFPNMSRGNLKESSSDLKTLKKNLESGTTSTRPVENHFTGDARLIENKGMALEALEKVSDYFSEMQSVSREARGEGNFTEEHKNTLKIDPAGPLGLLRLVDSSTSGYGSDGPRLSLKGGVYGEVDFLGYPSDFEWDKPLNQALKGIYKLHNQYGDKIDSLVKGSSVETTTPSPEATSPSIKDKVVAKDISAAREFFERG